MNLATGDEREVLEKEELERKSLKGLFLVLGFSLT
jgi:hypothetical protein